MRLLFFSALEGHAMADLIFRQRVQTIDVFLGRYFADRIAAGAFRPADPLQMAWNFIGMVTFHVLLHELFGQKPPPHVTRELAVQEMVTTFLGGVRSDRGGCPCGTRTAVVRGPAKTPGASLSSGHRVHRPRNDRDRHRAQFS